FPEIERVGTREGNIVVAGLISLKHLLMNGIERVLSDPHAALAGGILLGVEQSLGESLEDAFRNTGLIHIVVLSGYNVTIVAVAIASVLKHIGFGLKLRSALSIGGIVAFAFVVGLGPTVVRASIMGALVVLAHASGRRSDMLRALALAAAVMVAINPLILVYDPSFQLSAIATFGLMTLSPIIERWLMFVPTFGGLREIVMATVATQIAVLPLLVYMVGTFSLVSVPVNVLALPAVAPAMLFSFLAGLVGIVSRALALPLAMIAYALLGYILFVVEIFNALPFSHVLVPPMPLWVPLAMYVALGAWLFFAYRRNSYELGIPSLAERLG
ncbi:MAG: ComEC/Rec2 family competence protein, partial [Candidatus Paceibacterota bacterium]